MFLTFDASTLYFCCTISLSFFFFIPSSIAIQSWSFLSLLSLTCKINENYKLSLNILFQLLQESRLKGKLQKEPCTFMVYNHIDSNKKAKCSQNSTLHKTLEMIVQLSDVFSILDQFFR